MKLGDYWSTTAGCSSDNLMTQWHSAPEVFNGEREFKSDVWSLGITMMELVEGETSYRIVGYWSTAKDLICRGDPPSLSSEKCSAECVDFVGECLVMDVSERWSVKQLMEVSDCEMV